MSSRHDYRDRERGWERSHHRSSEADRDAGRSKRLPSRSDRISERSPKKSRDDMPTTDFSQSGIHYTDNVAEDGQKKSVPTPDETVVKDLPSGKTKATKDEKKDSCNMRVDRSTTGTRRSFDSREVSELQPHFQHDQRSSAGQGGQRYDRRATDYSRDVNQRDQFADRVRSKHDERRLQERGEYTRANNNSESVWKHDGFYQLESEESRPKKRPAFREEKVPIQPEPATTAAKESGSKMLDLDQPPLHVSRGDERRNYQPRGVQRDERPFRKGDTRNDWRNANQRNDASRNGNQFQGHLQGRDSRGRERLDDRYGEAGSTRGLGGGKVDKWKHDLFDEANSSPPKNEEEQIAKVEALLAL